MGSIFELGGEYKLLYAMMTEAEECEEQAFLDTLEGIMGEIEVKGASYIALLNRLEMEENACDAQIEKWKHEKSLRRNGRNRLKDRLIKFLVMMGMKELKAGDTNIRLIGNGGKAPLRFTTETATDIPLEDMKVEFVPKEYRKVVVSETIDSDKIRAALDSGKTLDWVRYGERGSHLKF